MTTIHTGLDIAKLNLQRHLAPRLGGEEDGVRSAIS
jgi:hypothetical protein